MGLMNPYLIQLIEMLKEYNSTPNQQAFLGFPPGSESGTIQITYLDEWNQKVSASILFSSFQIAIEKVKKLIN
jgi:hypothetical protein